MFDSDRLGQDEPSTGGLLARVALGLLAVFVALTVLGWIIGAVLDLLRLAALIGIAVAVIWAITRAKSSP